MSTSNNNPKGILLILIGMAIFSIQDALIKFVFEDTALYELYFGRTLTAFILLLLYLKITLSHTLLSQLFFSQKKAVRPSESGRFSVVFLPYFLRKNIQRETGEGNFYVKVIFS